MYVSSLEEYKSLKTGDDGDRFGCSKCGRTYRRKKTLGRHLRFDCDTVPRFSCNLCHKPFKHGYLVLKHMRQDHNMDIEKQRQRSMSLK